MPAMSRSDCIDLSLVRTSPAELDVDLIVVAACHDADGVLDPLEAASGGGLRQARERGEWSREAFSVYSATMTDPGWRCRRALLISAGARAEWSVERARRVAAAAGRLARQRRAQRIAFVTPHDPLTPAEMQAIAEGFVHSSFSEGLYKTSDPELSDLRDVQIGSIGLSKDHEAAIVRGHTLGCSANLARSLVNEPGNVLTPRRLAERAAAAVQGTSLGIDVLEEDRLERLGMGLLLGVARGSAEPPRLIVIRHEPPGAPAHRVLGLVGKGVTFDSGGISLKPADGMDRMKDDMAGGAAVIAAMQAIARLQAPVRVIGVVPAVENMPGGRAIRPGDVLHGASGKSVEVNNTDAEGRLILADALWYAAELGATHLVDLATLTGACIIALGHVASGLFGGPEWWMTLVRETADRAGDRVWPLPIFPEYRDQLKSEIADLINSGGRPAGAATAAMFLREFVGDRPWAHLDIAGTAWAEEPKPYQPKGPTGVGVRGIAELAFTADRWPV